MDLQLRGTVGINSYAFKKREIWRVLNDDLSVERILLFRLIFTLAT